MRAFIIICLVAVAQVDCQFWKYPHQFLNNFSWSRQGKATSEKLIAEQQMTAIPEAHEILPPSTNGVLPKTVFSQPISSISTNVTPKTNQTRSTTKRMVKVKSSFATTAKQTNLNIGTSPVWSTVPITTQMPSGVNKTTIYLTQTTTTGTEATTLLDTTTQDVTGTTEEPRDNHRVHDFYLSKREKPQVKISSNISQNLLPLPEGAGAALVKPTKYHYYPHNQHIYLLPECAIQQVCNAVYVRLNWTQPLCACPSRYRDPCSASLNSDDQHTTELTTDRASKALTLVKTCEPTADMRVCRAPRDWSLLALQNIRTGKSHYLVICRCTDTSVLECNQTYGAFGPNNPA